MKKGRKYTIQMQPAPGQGYVATIVELGKTVTGSTQLEAWNAAHEVIFDEQRRLLEAAKTRRRGRQQQQQSHTVA